MLDVIVIYGIIEGCKYCDIAKATLAEGGIDFVFVDIKEDINFYSMFKTVHQTVPQIYRNGINLGGSEVAKELCNNPFEGLDFE